MRKNRLIKYVYVLWYYVFLFYDYPSTSISVRDITNKNNYNEDHHHSEHIYRYNETNRSINKGIIVIPGLGRVDRLALVVDNLKLIYTQSNDNLNQLHPKHGHGNSIDSNDSAERYTWDCIIYIYASRESNSLFWNQIHAIHYLYSICDVIEVPDKRVAENLHMLQPALIRNYYDRVFLLLDDCILTSSFNMTRLLSIMHRNHLTVISPAVSFDLKISQIYA